MLDGGYMRMRVGKRPRGLRRMWNRILELRLKDWACIATILGVVITVLIQLFPYVAGPFGRTYKSTMQAIGRIPPDSYVAKTDSLHEKDADPIVWNAMQRLARKPAWIASDEVYHRGRNGWRYVYTREKRKRQIVIEIPKHQLNTRMKHYLMVCESGTCSP